MRSEYMTEPDDYETQDLSVTIRQYINIIKRRLWILIAVFVTVVITTAVLTYRQTPVYRASTKIIIEPEPFRTDGIMGTIYSIKGEYFQTQCDIILSERVLEKAVNLLKDTSPDLTPAALKGRVSINQVKDTYLATITVSHTNPESAAEEANSLARAYILYTQEDKLASSKDAFSWLSEQIAVLKSSVKKSELELLKFKEKENIVSLEKRQTLLEENLSLVHNEYMQASLKGMELETLMNEIRKIAKKPELAESLPKVINNDMIGNLKTEYHRLNIELSKQSRKFKPRHPIIVALKSQIEDIKERLTEEVQKILKSVEIEYRINKTNEESIQRNLESLKRESMQLSQQAVQYGVLKREAQSNSQMYSALLGNLKKVDITSSMTPNNIRIVDKAKAPKGPASPNKRKRILNGILMGLALGIGLCFLTEYMDDTVKDEKDLQVHLNGNLLGMTPKRKKQKQVDRIEDYSESTIQSFRNIRTILTFYRMEHLLKTLLVTSTVSGEGKTSCVAILGKLFAESGYKTLVVDVDFFRPRLRKLFQINENTGVTDYFLFGKSADEITFQTNIENLWIIPSGLIPSNPKNLFETDKIQTFIDDLSPHYDMIIFDTPPLGAYIELSFFCSLVDGLAYIVKTNSTSRHHTKKMLKILETSRTNLIGFILTHVTKTHDEQYYYKKQYYQYYQQDSQNDGRSDL